MLTEKDYCDYETCVALRGVGCRIQTEWYIHQPSYERGACYLCFGIPQETSVLDECDYIPRLSLYEAQKWLREEKGYHIEIDRVGRSTGYDWQVSVVEMEHNLCKSVEHNNETYEEALSEGIKEAVKILKEIGNVE